MALPMDTQTILFWLSKIVGLAIDVRQPFYIGLVVGIALLWTRWRGIGRVLLTAILAIQFATAAAPVGKSLNVWLEERIPPPTSLPARIDGIVVLGGDADNTMLQVRPLSPGGSPMRQVAAADLARRYPDARIVYSGGSGNPLDPNTTDAAGARILLPALGLDPARVEFEENSRNTFENARNSFELAKPKPGETWLLVTSAFHMPRALGCFRKAGWNVIPYPVGYRTMPHDAGDWSLPRSFDASLFGIANALSELVGLTSYYWLGRTDAWLPSL
jgi:uncharacterized SAM-binding protein YcdF (DUF218 family)